jgi:hypothetical protein
MRNAFLVIALFALPSAILANDFNLLDTIPLPENSIRQRAQDAREQKPKFSHQTSRGAIYILPIDRMPCLVSDNIPKMPGQYDYRMPKMPNPSPRYRIRPDEN